MKSLFLRLAVVGLLLIQGMRSRAEYYGFNNVSGIEATVQEVRWPYWAESTYNAIYSETLSGSDGGSCYFYGGVPMASPGYPATGSPASIIWSFWPPSNTSVPGAAVTAFWTATNMYAPPHVGEGASGKAAGNWPLLQTNQWYRFAFRVWRPVDGTPHLAYAAKWLRDPATGIWYHYATMKIPFAATGFTGLGGFIEDFSHGNRNPRRTDFRNVYYFKNNAWLNANQFTPSVRQTGERGTGQLIENNTAAFYETCSSTTYSGNLDYDNGPRSITLTIAQPSAPSFDPIVVSSSGASVYGNQLLVNWSMPSTSSPPFAYKIDIFNNSDYAGAPSVTFYDRDPEARQKLLNIAGVATPYVKLTITDIFNNTNAPILMTPSIATLSPATNAAGAVSGLACKYYEGTWDALPNFSGLFPTYQGADDFPDLTLRRRRSSYGFAHTGFINVPSDGLYAFTVNSCDGSRLYVDGALVVDHDGVHSPSERSGSIALAAGKHAVDLRYFFKAQNSDAGDLTDQLDVSYEGPGFAPMPVPSSAWFRVPANGEPAIALAGLTNGSTLAGTNISFASSITTNGNTVGKVQFYVGDSYWGQASAASMALDTFLWSGPGNGVRARLFYNANSFVDSPLIYLNTTNAALAPWQLAGASEHVQPFGAKIENNRWSLIGDGLNLLYRPVDGNCTLIARVADLTSTAAAPDGTTADSGWAAGIIMRQSTNSTPGTPLGNDSTARYASVYATVNNDTRFQDHTMSNAGGPFASAGLGGQRWLQLRRIGLVFTTLVSADGQNWTPVNTNTLSGAPTRMYVGVFTYASPSQNPNVHTATFDSLSLVGSVVGPPGVTVTPQSATIYSGQSATFSALPSGQPPFAYQWQYNGTNLTGETGASLTLNGLQPTNSGIYSVVLSNASGTASSAAKLSVLSPIPLATQMSALGPVAWWRLNESSGTVLSDSIGGFSGTAQGNLTLGAQGAGAPQFPGFEPDNRCIQMNGTDTAVAMPALNLNTNGVTITCWLKRSVSQAAWAGIVFCRSGTTTAGLHFGTANELRYTWNDAAGSYNYNSGLTVPNNLWTFAALVIESGRARLYMATNSTLRGATNNLANAAQAFAGTTYLGYDPNSSSRRFNGLLDEVAIFKRALTTAELTQLLNASLSAAPSIMINEPADGATFPKRSDIPVSASFAANGHTLNKVQVFNGARLISEATGAPYGVTVSNVPPGIYTLVAQAFYDGGSLISSTPVNLTVSADWNPAAPQLNAKAASASGPIQLMLGGIQGQHYRVDYADEIPPMGIWQTLTDIVSLAESPFAVVDATGSTQRFYRAVSMP